MAAPGVKLILMSVPNILFIICSNLAAPLVPPKVPSPQSSLSLPSLFASLITPDMAGDHCAAGKLDAMPAKSAQQVRISQNRFIFAPDKTMVVYTCRAYRLSIKRNPEGVCHTHPR